MRLSLSARKQLSIRQILSYGLCLLLAVSFNPALASAGLMNIELNKGDSVVTSVMNMHPESHRSVLTNRDTLFSAADMTMAEGATCQPDCDDCCPGLCSVYLPARVGVATFLPVRAALAKSLFQHTVSFNAPLFRPPISR